MTNVRLGVVGITNAGIPVLDSIINAVILTSASSSANAFLYTGSRYLFALAQNRQAPRIFLTCSKAGVPYYAVAVTASISGLTYLSVGKGGSAKAFAVSRYHFLTDSSLLTLTPVVPKLGHNSFSVDLGIDLCCLYPIP